MAAVTMVTRKLS